MTTKSKNEMQPLVESGAEVQTPTLPLIFLERAPREKATVTPAIFLLHGRTSVAKTIFSMEGLLDPRFYVFALQAPFRSDFKGIEGYEWFVPKPKEEDGAQLEDSAALLDRRRNEMETSERLLEAQIASLVTKRGLDPSQVYLIGFSQGAAMSFLLSLRGMIAIHGAVPMSGFMPGEIRSWKQLALSTKFIIPHGDKDEVLDASSSIHANDFLIEHGIASEFRMYKGRHKMSLDIVRYLSTWIAQLAGLPPREA